MDIIHEKIDTHPNFLDILKHVNKIITYIDYEVDKFKDTRASVIFTGSITPATLFTMASHTKYSDFTQGIQNVKSELKLIQDKYGIYLETEVSEIFYARFSCVAIKFLENLNTDHANILKKIISNRGDDPDLVEDMHDLITRLDNLDDCELTKMIKIILQIDPLYKNFLCENQDAQFLFEDSYLLHNIDTKALNIDFIDYAVKFVSKVYQQVFGKKDNDDEKSSPAP